MGEDWRSVPTILPLAPGELQIWRVELPAVTESPDVYRWALSAEELARAERLRVPQVRQQFMVGRACLRHLLGLNLELRACGVPITLSRYGKPEVASGVGDRLHFNLAHSRSTVLIALCRDSPVGVDLEYLDRATDAMEVARASFTPSESRQIERIPTTDAQRRAFFECWTRKEAVIKADGRGLSLPLASFEVPVLAKADRSPVVIDGEATWYVTGLGLANDLGNDSGKGLGNDLAGDIAAAVATRSPSLEHQTLDFPLAALDPQSP
jgi:4'-phosphopantetheinyl transferase